jgi:hypothetical protein
VHRLAIHESPFLSRPKISARARVCVFFSYNNTSFFLPSVVNYILLLLASHLPVCLSVVYCTIPSAALIILYQRNRISENATLLLLLLLFNKLHGAESFDKLTIHRLINKFSAFCDTWCLIEPSTCT